MSFHPTCNSSKSKDQRWNVKFDFLSTGKSGVHNKILFLIMTKGSALPRFYHKGCHYKFINQPNCVNTMFNNKPILDQLVVLKNMYNLLNSELYITSFFAIFFSFFYFYFFKWFFAIYLQRTNLA